MFCSCFGWWFGARVSSGVCRLYGRGAAVPCCAGTAARVVRGAWDTGDPSHVVYTLWTVDLFVRDGKALRSGPVELFPAPGQRGTRAGVGAGRPRSSLPARPAPGAPGGSRSVAAPEGRVERRRRMGRSRTASAWPALPAHRPAGPSRRPPTPRRPARRSRWTGASGRRPPRAHHRARPRRSPSRAGDRPRADASRAYRCGRRGACVPPCSPRGRSGPGSRTGS